MLCIDVPLECFVVVTADLRNKGPVDSLVDIFLLLQAIGDFFGEPKAKVEN